MPGAFIHRGPRFANGKVMVALRDIFESLGTLEQLRVDAPTFARQRNGAALELGRILKADFGAAVETLVQRGAQAPDRRALVRCFGSVIDGLVNVLCTIAEVACASAGRPHPVLQEKSAEPGAAILHRICISYRTMSRCLPGSPLAKFQARRWEELKACLDIRNRVVHPETPSDLEISDSNIRLITEVARQFIHDFEALAQWQAKRSPTPASEGTSNRTRRNRKRGGLRHRKCSCGSGRKYKSCCRVAPLPA
jgi:hypothetical protein